MDIVNVYVDGSYGKNNLTYCASWAYIVFNIKNEILHKDKGILYGEINSIRQIGGELKSVMEAINYCIKNKYKANIYFDYIGIRNWCHDLFNKTPWKCKNKWTKEYREFMILNKDYINKMIKVKSHSGNEFNDMVDKLAKIE